MADRHEDAPRTDFRTAAARFLNSAFSLARTRAELASIEFAEERERLKVSAMLIGAAVFMLSFAVLGVATWVVVFFWDSYPLGAIAAVTIVFAAAGALLLWRSVVMTRESPMPFAATLAELDKDRDWLSAPTERRGEMTEPAQR